MIVTMPNIDRVCEDIAATPIRGYDTETYGLRFQDRLFSIIISTPRDDYYFNFNNDPDHLGNVPPIYLNKEKVFKKLVPLFREGVWGSHNAKFDQQKIMLEGWGPPKTVHCTLATERILRNDLMDYSLDSIAPRYGVQKDGTVDAYIKEHKLYTKIIIPFKKKTTLDMHFDKVPFDIITKYGEKDARVHRIITEQQRFALGI